MEVLAAIIISLILLKCFDKVGEKLYWWLSFGACCLALVSIAIIPHYPRVMFWVYAQVVLHLMALVFLVISIVSKSKIRVDYKAKPAGAYLDLIEVAPAKGVAINQILRYELKLRTKLESKAQKASLHELKRRNLDIPQGILLLEAFEKGLYMRHSNPQFKAYNDLEKDFASLGDSIDRLFLTENREVFEEEFVNLPNDELKSVFNKLKFTETDRNVFVVIAHEMHKRGFVEEIRSKILSKES